MVDDASKGHSHESALQVLLRAIAARDRPTASRLLAELPVLAGLAVKAGATRQGAASYFLTEIGHYVYAGDTALHVAAAAYERDTAAELVSKGAYAGARNRRGAEPLHYASDGSPGSKTWHPDTQHAIVEFLIRAGADPNAEDKSGVAPLHRAVRTRSTGAVRALLSNGANVRRRNASGSTPLHLAVQNTGRGGSGSVASHEEQAHIVRLLLKYGARRSDTDAAGRSVDEAVKAEWIRTLLAEAS